MRRRSTAGSRAEADSQGAGRLTSPVREETDGKGPGQGHLAGGRLHSGGGGRGKGPEHLAPRHHQPRDTPDHTHLNTARALRISRSSAATPPSGGCAGRPRLPGRENLPPDVQSSSPGPSVVLRPRAQSAYAGRRPVDQPEKEPSHRRPHKREHSSARAGPTARPRYLPMVCRGHGEPGSA